MITHGDVDSYQCLLTVNVKCLAVSEQETRSGDPAEHQ